MQSNFIEQLTHYCNIAVSSCSRLSEALIDFYDFTFMLNGSMTYYADGRKIVLEKGDAIFLKPNTLCSREQGTTPVHYVSFNFITGPEVEFPFDMHIKKCITTDIKKIVSAFPLNHLSPKFYSKEKCQNILNFILLELLSMETANCNNNHVLRILKYIDEHLTEKLSLSSIAEIMHLSKEYISGIFSNETGKQLTYYINEQKSLLAKEIIINNEMTLSSIPQYLGFESYDYFSKTFKKHIGIPPSKLKRNSEIIKTD